MELNYPYLNEEQIKNIKQELIPKFNEEDINNLKQLEDAEADGLEWLEMFEDYIYPDNLSHISNKKIGLNEEEIGATWKWSENGLELWMRIG